MEPGDDRWWDSDRQGERFVSPLWCGSLKNHGQQAPLNGFLYTINTSIPNCETFPCTKRLTENCVSLSLLIILRIHQTSETGFGDGRWILDGPSRTYVTLSLHQVVEKRTVGRVGALAEPLEMVYIYLGSPFVGHI